MRFEETEPKLHLQPFSIYSEWGFPKIGVPYFYSIIFFFWGGGGSLKENEIFIPLSSSTPESSGRDWELGSRDSKVSGALISAVPGSIRATFSGLIWEGCREAWVSGTVVRVLRSRSSRICSVMAENMGGGGQMLKLLKCLEQGRPSERAASRICSHTPTHPHTPDTPHV